MESAPMVNTEDERKNIQIQYSESFMTKVDTDNSVIYDLFIDGMTKVTNY